MTRLADEVQRGSSPGLLNDRVVCRVCGQYFKVLSWSHLQRHGLTCEEYKRDFDVDYVFSDATRAEQSDRLRKTPASRAKAPFIPKSRAEILADLKQLAGRIPELTMEIARDYDHALPHQAQHLFGTWNDALIAAGIAPVKRTWTREGLVEAILERQRRGDALNAKAVYEEDPGLYGVACIVFGSWEAALTVGGVDPDAIRQSGRPWDEERLGEELRAWCDAHGALNATVMGATKSNLYSAVLRHCGSLDAAAERFNLPLDRRHRRWSRDVIIEEIQRLDRSGHRLTIPRIEDLVPGLDDAARLHFGSWEAALEAAGCNRDWQAEDRERRCREVDERLRAWVARNGPLAFKRLADDDAPLCAAVRRCYGSLERAARTLDLPYESLMRTWDREQILQEIGKRRASGGSLRATDVQREDANLCAAAARYFGGWGPALEAAGVDYEKVRSRRPRDPASVAEALRAWVKKHGPLHAPTLKNTDQPLYLAMYRSFGKPGVTAQRLGLPYEPTRSKSGRVLRSWTAEAVLQAVRDRAARGASLRDLAIREDDAGLRTAAKKFFGTWREAVRAAGCASTS